MVRLSPEIQDILEGVEKSVSTDLSQSRQLPPSVYTDPAFFEWEREAIWFRSWVCVGRVDQIPEPGDYLSVDLMGEPIIVVRDNDGEVRVMSAVCAHRGNTVLTGAGNCGQWIRCSYHFWTYTLDGRLVGAPEMNDVVDIEVLRGETRLTAAKVEIWHGYILANFDPKAESFAPTAARADSEMTAYAVGDMRSTSTVSLTGLPWNWKILQENFLEPYHLTYLHQGSHDFAPADRTQVPEREPGENVVLRYSGFLRKDGSLMRTGWGWPAVFPIIDGLTDEQRTRVTWVAIFPNMFIGLCPDMVLSYSMIPEAVDRMTMLINFLFPPDRFDDAGLEEKCDELLAGSTTVVDQDVAVNTAVQQNLSSRFAVSGRFSTKERILGMFHNWLDERYRSYLEPA